MQRPETEPLLKLRIDTDALVENWRALDTMSGKAKAGAAIKADAYGLDVQTCVPALRDAGCDVFFVAHWSEVPDVIAHVPGHQVAVLNGPVRDSDVLVAKDTGAVPVINSVSQARRWAENGGGLCHVMIDTGINRLGIAPTDLDDPSIVALDVDILMSHLACADEDSPMNAQQLRDYSACLDLLRYRRASLANSAGVALGEAFAFDVTRPGLSLYGGVPRKELDGKIRQVAFVDAAIMQVRHLKAGDAVGYNSEFVATQDMRVGTVALGYADGFLRCRGPGNYLCFGEKNLPLLGKVSMDMIVVDLSHAPEAREGDWLNVPFELREAALQSGLSQYELITSIGPRLRF